MLPYDSFVKNLVEFFSSILKWDQKTLTSSNFTFLEAVKLAFFSLVG